MKKQELFNATVASSSLIRQYLATQDDDDSRYLNPNGKKDRISNAIEDLQAKLIRVSSDTPSFDEVEAIAESIARQCRAPDVEPAIQKTKEQIYIEIVRELKPLISNELIGKKLCYKSGVHDFAYFNCTRVEVRVGMYNRLEIHACGPGFAIDTETPSSSYKGHVFPNFKDFYFNVSSLVLTGKDEYRKTWLYVISDDEYKKQFDRAIAGISRTIGLIATTEG